MAIRAKRGGVTAANWYENNIPVSVASSEDDIFLRLKLDSKGGGQTDVMIEIPPEDFPAVMGAMMQTDLKATTLAFAKAVIAQNKTKS